MANPNKHVSKGDPLEFTAEAYNGFADASAWVNQNRNNRTGNPSGGIERGGIVLVQNASGAAVQQLGILGIKGVAVTPAQNQSQFINNWALVGITPTAASTGLFVVTAGPLAINAFGPAYLFGACPAFVNFTNANDPFADITVGDSTQLTSGGSGAAQILLNPANATGRQLALVRLGAGKGGAAFDVDVTQNGGSAGNSTTRTSFTYDVFNEGTSNKIGSTLSPKGTPGRMMLCTCAVGTKGLAHYDTSGTLVLDFVYDEFAGGTTACS